MNSNGYGRGRMTGSSSSTNENLSWLTDVVASQTSQTHSQSTEGALAGRLEEQSQERLSHSGIHSAGSSSGPVFPQPITMADGGQRLLTGNQYLSANPSMGQYSPLYTIHGQPQHNVPQQYGSLYPYSSYPSENPSLISAGHYPSYSAVLASMGSHIQHVNPGSQSQIPRNTPFMTGTPMPQYSPMASHRSLSAASSPGPLHPSGGYNPQGESLVHDNRSVKSEIDRSQRSGSTSNLRDERSHMYSSGHLSGKSVPLSSQRESDLFYKFPSGKEGSLKHRILKRPVGSPVESGIGEEYKYSHTMRSDEQGVKRSKLASSVSTSLVSSGAEGPHTVGQGSGPPTVKHDDTEDLQVLPPPHLHYPAHFKKGSIIQLTDNKFKRVEDLETSDFIKSADISDDLKIDSSTVIRIDEHVDRGTAILGFSVGEHKVKVTVEATLEHPFFVFHQGWTSCSPMGSSKRYGLECRKLAINDVCVSLTHKDVLSIASELGEQQTSLSSPLTSSHEVQGQEISSYSESVRSSEGHSSGVSYSTDVHDDMHQRRQFSTTTSGSHVVDNRSESNLPDRKL